MLGYLGNDGWRDMSDYLVHLTGGPRRGGDGRTALSGILEHQCVVPAGLEDGKGVGTVRTVTWLSGTQCAACLSEIPLGWLNRLVDRHGRFGIGFTKSYIRSVGGAPVWYLWRDSKIATELQSLITEAMRRRDPEEPIWKLTPYVENPARGDTYRYEFDWEREWRVRDGLAFTPDDIAFLFAPERDHGWARHLLCDLSVGTKPILDPCWKMSELQKILAKSDL